MQDMVQFDPIRKRCCVYDVTYKGMQRILVRRVCYLLRITLNPPLEYLFATVGPVPRII